MVPLKTWILQSVNKVNALWARHDLPPRQATLDAAARRPLREPRVQPPAVVALDDEYLGPYAPLITAIREDLEQFVVAHVRLHLAIAEHDRYLLTSIDLRCVDDGEPLQLLRRFTREFQPEQIKRYLARQVVPSLPNAAAIDLSQFGGLTVVPKAPDAPADESEEFGELLEALRSGPESSGESPYEITIRGRWIQVEPLAGNGTAPAPAAAPTPLAGQTLEIDIEDASGSRRVALPSVVPGRRYMVGKDESCDLVVAGTYASRRHAEIWLDQGSWRVLDAGSTNGIRVETGGRVLGRSTPFAGAGTPQEALGIEPGARIVLSARAEGPRHDYPSVTLRLPEQPSTLATPIAPAAGATPKTPITPIVGGRAAGRAWTLAAEMASGVRTVRIDPAQLPFTIGRSRSQTLVVDLAHEGVSGQHLAITGLDETGAAVLVRGDNGVVLGGVSHPAGARCTWRAGETLVLGHALPREPVCKLTLQRGQ